MSYSSFEKDKLIMENWRKFAEGEESIEEQEQLDEAVPAIVMGAWAGLKILAGFVASVAPLIIANRKAIRDASSAILANPSMHPRIKQFAKMNLKMLEPFDAWDNVVSLPLEDAKNPKALIDALSADLQGQVPDDSGEASVARGQELYDVDDIPPGLE